MLAQWGKFRDQFPFYRGLGQNRKLVYGLARSVIRCFLVLRYFFTAELISRILEQNNKCEDSVVESGVCGGASEFDIVGTGVLSTRGGLKGHAAFPHRQLARKQSRRQKSAVHEQRQEKVVKRSSTVERCLSVIVFPPTHPNAQERGVLWGRSLRGVRVGTSFRFTGSWAKSVNYYSVRVSPKCYSLFSGKRSF